MARPPIPTMGVGYARLDVSNQVDSLNALAEANGYNFSVLKLVDVIEKLFNDMQGMAGELGTCQYRIKYIASAVQSTDSSLASAWENVGTSMGKFMDKYGEMAKNIKYAADNYIQSTLDNELAAVSNTEGISESIENINSKLDALFNE